MNTVSLARIKKELNEKSESELINCCLRLAKFRKENKELLHYLLFEAFDEESYKDELKAEIEDQFDDINVSSVYYAKKSIRKILRFVSKHIKYSGLKQTEVELLICFCLNFRNLELPFYTSKVLLNIYDRQIVNIQKALATLDEDFHFDYQSDVDLITRPLPR